MKRFFTYAGVALLTFSGSSMLNAQSGSGPTDPQIAGIVVAANQIDIDAGKLALKKTKNAEVRQLKITNHGDEPRRVEITSYLEIALNGQQADLSHPAFHKLFVETEYIAEETALLAKRRPRDAQQPTARAVHVLSFIHIRRCRRSHLCRPSWSHVP